MPFLNKNGLERLWYHITLKLGNKVDKVEGKTLSTEDYTTEEKNKLAGIEDGANKTTVDEALSATSTNPVQNSVINQALVTMDNSIQGLSNTVNGLDVPTALSDLTEDATHRVVTDVEKATWNNKSNFSGSYNDLTDAPAIPSVDGLATEDYVNTQILNIDYPVDSINGKTGAVELTAADIGALPADTIIPSIDGLASETYVDNAIETFFANIQRAEEVEF